MQPTPVRRLHQGDNDHDSFDPVLNRKDEKKTHQASEPQARVPGLAKPKPLVLEGASEKLKASALEVKKVLRNYKDARKSCGTIKTQESLAGL